MLSRRDKLLIQPWDERRYKDHRSKVKSALPAIDDRAPAARPHVTVKSKKWQRELDRTRQVQSDNHSLLQRLNAIMKVNRLDNRWTDPLPNFHKKVGLFYNTEHLKTKLSARAHARSVDSPREPHDNVRCFACEMTKKQFEVHRNRDTKRTRRSVET